jgi:hypothetical protein
MTPWPLPLRAVQEAVGDQRRDGFDDAHGAVRVRNGPDMEEVELPAETWASAVAHVSAPGEESSTFHAALSFHSGLQAVTGSRSLNDIAQDIIDRAPELEPLVEEWFAATTAARLREADAMRKWSS